MNFSIADLVKQLAVVSGTGDFVIGAELPGFVGFPAAFPSTVAICYEAHMLDSSGNRVAPMEVEHCLMEHPAVAEAGVIGKPDEVVGEVVKAFVSLKQGFEPGDALRLELLGHARRKLGAAVAPKEIAFLATLPRTRSGKIMRRLLKARELGLPEGDTSTLEAGT